MATDASQPRIVPLRKLVRSDAVPVRYHPDAELSAELVARLDLVSLKKARLTGSLHPVGQRDWRLEAQIGASAAQTCTVTLQPVTTRVDQVIERLYTADFADPTDAEAESPDDDTIEPLPEVLDLGEVFAEALALALPDFPRAPDAELADATATPPGAAPITDADLNPFAALAVLKTPNVPDG